MTDQVLNKRKFLFRFRLKNQEDIIYITSFDLILIFQWDLLKRKIRESSKMKTKREK